MSIPFPLPSLSPAIAPTLGPPKPSAPPAPSPSTTPTRRTPLSPRNGKRTPTSARAWHRRLGDNAAVTPPSPSTSGTSTPQEAWHPQNEIGPSGFIFSPAVPPLSSLSRGEQERSAFDLYRVAMEIDDIAGMPILPPPPSRHSRAPSRVTMRRPRSRLNTAGRTGINDLPDELLLRIFSFLDDQQGFRPLSGRSLSTPEWYTPPLRISLVCQRWLPLARHLCYRFLKISEGKRISGLYAAFAMNGDLAQSVRHLYIELPVTAAEKLRLPALRHPGMREVDSDLDSPVPSSRSSSPNKSPSKTRKPLTLEDELRAVFQSCSRLLRLEISGVPPALLLSSSSKALSALHHLHQLRLSTVTELTLRGGTGDIALGGDGVPLLDAPSVRDALLALTGLRRLLLKGFSSSRASEGALDFAPTRTHLGLCARPLPLRARAQALLPLEQLAIVECCFSPTDLRALLSQCQAGKLRALAVDDQWSVAQARRNRAAGRWAKPSVEALHAVADLVQGLEWLRITLFNYPPVTGVPSAAASTALRSPERTSPRHPVRALPGTMAGAGGEKHILDSFVAQLEALVALDVGGSVVSPVLFQPAAPVPSPAGSNPLHSSSAGSTAAPSLPSTLQTLTLRSCDLVPPAALVPFLASGPPALKTLHTLGGSEHGWARPAACLAVQRACWAAGVRWVTGAMGGAGAAVAPAPASRAEGPGIGAGPAADAGVSVADQYVRRIGVRAGGEW
ncbi:hypothetical protein JCM3770_007341 [Rhodotorula araucariae]